MVLRYIIRSKTPQCLRCAYQSKGTYYFRKMEEDKKVNIFFRIGVLELGVIKALPRVYQRR